MATTSGGYRRNFIDSTVDMGANATVTAYTCPTGKVATIQIRTVKNLSSTSLATGTIHGIIRTLDGAGGNVDVTVDTSATVAFITSNGQEVFNGYKTANGVSSPYQYYIFPGDSVRIFNSNGAGKSVRIRYTVIEEENADI